MRSFTRAALAAAALLAASCSAPPPAATASAPARQAAPAVAAAPEPLPAQRCPTRADTADRLATADPGATVRLSAFGCAGLRAAATWTGGRLAVFSGAAAQPARLYEDSGLGPTSAPNRVLFSVANAGAAPLRFAVVLTNLGATPGRLALLRAGATTPASSPRRALERWLTSAAATPAEVEPGAAVLLDPLFTDAAVPPGGRVEGLWDYAFDQPHRLQLCALVAGGATACSTLPRAPSGPGQLRGTFPWNERRLEVGQLELGAGLTHLPLNTVEQRGVDALTGATVVLPNNLGVLRRVKLPGPGRGEPNLALLLQGQALGAAARASAGITPGGAVALPEQLPEGAAALLGTFDSDDGAISVEYLATPGSSPAELLAVPF